MWYVSYLVGDENEALFFHFLHYIYIRRNYVIAHVSFFSWSSKKGKVLRKLLPSLLWKNVTAKIMYNLYQRLKLFFSKNLIIELRVWNFVFTCISYVWMNTRWRWTFKMFISNKEICGHMRFAKFFSIQITNVKYHRFLAFNKTRKVNLRRNVNKRSKI